MIYLQSFGCGLCFTIGAFIGVMITATVRHSNWENHAKRVEARLQTYAETMILILEEIKTRK